MKMIALVLFAGCAYAQTVTATAPATRPGGTATVTVSLAGSPGAAFQFFLSQITGVVYTAAPGPSLPAGKTLTCAPSPAPLPALYGCVVAGGVGVLGDGAVAIITFPAPAAGVYPLSLSLQLGASAAGDAIAVAAGPTLSLTVSSTCDVNGDGRVDSADVALAIQGAITRLISAAVDLSGDGVVNVVDVQRVVVAANGGACRTGL